MRIAAAPMHRPCPDPRCRDGLACSRSKLSGGRAWVPCGTCRGTGRVDEKDEDLRTAGIVLWDPSDEDFRSSPTHWSP